MQYKIIYTDKIHKISEALKLKILSPYKDPGLAIVIKAS